MSSTPNSTVEASTTSSSPASCMASNNNAPKYGTRVPNRVFVGGLSADTTEAEMEAVFMRHGMVTSVKIISDRAGVSKGYGFITFETEEQASNLLKMNEVYLKNRKLNIAPAIKKQYDMCGTMQPSYGRSTFDTSPSPGIPNGSTIYYSSTGMPYTFSSSYYPAAMAGLTAQPEAYTSAAASYAQQQQHQQQAPQPPQQTQGAAAAAAATQAAAAASYAAGYPYIYPTSAAAAAAAAAAQAMYAPQQYYQTIQPQFLQQPQPVCMLNEAGQLVIIGVEPQIAATAASAAAMPSDFGRGDAAVTLMGGTAPDLLTSPWNLILPHQPAFSPTSYQENDTQDLSNFNGHGNYQSRGGARRRPLPPRLHSSASPSNCLPPPPVRSECNNNNNSSQTRDCKVMPPDLVRMVHALQMDTN